jgi:transposase
VDEKSQIQALDRTAPLLPMRPGQAERRTHDYKRHGTTSLFAALDVRSGKVIGQMHRRHRAIEFRKFLDRIDASVPPDREVHIVMDNYGMYKTPLICAWFAKRPCFHVHFTPTYGSWLNLVERWFAEITMKQIRRGAHRSVSELERAISVSGRAQCRSKTLFARTVSALSGRNAQLRKAKRAASVVVVPSFSRVVSGGATHFLCLVFLVMPAIGVTYGLDLPISFKDIYCPVTVVRDISCVAWVSAVPWAKRAMLTRTSSALLVHTKGFVLEWVMPFPEFLVFSAGSPIALASIVMGVPVFPQPLSCKRNNLRVLEVGRHTLLCYVNCDIVCWTIIRWRFGRC